MRRTLIILLVLLLQLSPAAAVEPDELLADPALESRARSLSAKMRCLVCQNQSIDDSDAPLARDLRLLIRQRLEAGDSDEAVRNYVVARYGDFVLLKPPFKSSTLLLWIAPFMILALAAFYMLTHRRSLNPDVPLTESEEQRLGDLMERETQDSRVEPANDVSRSRHGRT
jgi:cytochrome c-type biogenesis protein CcmH